MEFYILIGLLLLVIGILIGFLIRKHIAENKIGNAEKLAEKIVNDANDHADSIKQKTDNEVKASLLEAKDEVHRLRTEQEKENKERRSEIQRQEIRLQKREENLDRKAENLEQKEEKLSKKVAFLDEKEKELEELRQKESEELEHIAELSREEARETLLNDVRKDIVPRTLRLQSWEVQKVVREIKKLPEDKLDIELINVLGRSYMNLGDYENALDTYLSFIGKAKEDVKDVDIWLYSECGWLCNEVGDYEQELKYLLEAEKLLPQKKMTGYLIPLQVQVQQELLLVYLIEDF